eukprot:scaffold356_cov69-Phaeocystis_antarctica.AAC.6
MPRAERWSRIKTCTPRNTGGNERTFLAANRATRTSKCPYLSRATNFSTGGESESFVTSELIRQQLLARGMRPRCSSRASFVSTAAARWHVRRPLSPTAAIRAVVHPVGWLPPLRAVTKMLQESCRRVAGAGQPCLS